MTALITTLRNCVIVSGVIPFIRLVFIWVIAIETTGMTPIDTTVGSINVGAIAVNISDVVVGVVIVTILIIDVIIDSQLTTKGLSDQS